MTGRHTAPPSSLQRTAAAIGRGTFRTADELARAVLACTGVVFAGLTSTPQGFVVGSWLISQALLLTYTRPEET